MNKKIILLLSILAISLIARCIAQPKYKTEYYQDNSKNQKINVSERGRNY
jgi:hypothetical protein